MCKKFNKIMYMPIALIVTLTLLFGVTTISYSANGENNGAIITKLPWARLPADDSGLEIDLWTFDEAWQIETESGEVTLIAHFNIPEEYRPAKTIKNTGFLVITWAAGSTYDTMCISTPGGRAFLRAKIHK
jgi:hypothetical protein